MIGTSLNQSRISASIGAGGMGEVFRTRDTRLNRDVAIKVLPKDFVSDGDRLRRFEQEAKTLAALNHPNVLNCSAVSARSLLVALRHSYDEKCSAYDKRSAAKERITS